MAILLPFKMKGVGMEVGVMIHRDYSKNRLTLLEESYVEKILSRFCMKEPEFT